MYSDQIDLKLKVLDLLDKGLPAATIAKQLNIHRTTVYKWKRQRDLNNGAPLKTGTKGQGIQFPKLRVISGSLGNSFDSEMTTHNKSKNTDCSPEREYIVATNPATSSTKSSKTTIRNPSTGNHKSVLKETNSESSYVVRSSTTPTKFETTDCSHECGYTVATKLATSSTNCSQQVYRQAATRGTWLQWLQVTFVAIFCLVATAFIVWESGEAQGGTAATVLAGLIEVGALGLAAVPLRGRQAILKYFVLGLIGLYSVSLLCSASIAKSRHQQDVAQEVKKDKEFNKKLSLKTIEANRAREDLIRESLSGKRIELEALLQKGYVGASRRLSAEISELEGQLLKMGSPQTVVLPQTGPKQVVLAGVFWLCAGRAILVLLNFFAASLLHRYIRFQGCGV